MLQSVSSALTVGELAKRIGCPIHKIEYVVRSRKIQPIQRAGNARVFCEKDAEFITAEIRRIDAAKGGKA